MAYDTFITIKDYEWALANERKCPSIEIDKCLLEKGKLGVALMIDGDVIDISADLEHIEDIFDGWIEMFQQAKKEANKIIGDQQF